MQTELVDTATLRRAADAGMLALPAILVLYFSFASGGFFPDSQAFAVVVLALILVLRITLADNPFAGFSWPLGVAAASLSLYALWVLASGTWSDAPARALLDFNRVLIYLLVLVLLGSVPRTSARLRWMLRLLAAAMVIVAAVGLATRLLPDTFPTQPTIANKRLSYPLTYWNALGVMGSFGAILCLHLASSLRESLPVRVLASAAMPILAATVLLTFSRGGIAAGVVGLLVYALVGRPKGLVTGLLATGPLTVVAVMSTYDADLLATDDPTTPAAVAQGHHVARVVVLCALGSAGLRLLLALLDGRLARFRLPPRLRQPVTMAAWAGLALAVLVLAVAVNAPHIVSTNYDRFVHTATPTGHTADLRARLVDPSSNGRIDHWRVAMRGYRRSKLHGQGAGTYGSLWTKQRPPSFATLQVRDAHSLYVEALDELGLVGFALLLLSLVAVLSALLPSDRGPNRSLYAALFAVALTWALHAGVDWDWEMPAVTVWVFALGGAALAERRRRRRTPRTRRSVRPSQGARLLLGACVLAILVPATLVFISERHLSAIVPAYHRGDCDRVIKEAASSLDTLEDRPEPYEAIAYCQAIRGNPSLAVTAMEKAADRDPDNWEFRYGLALVRGAAGRDPVRDARQARRMNPQGRQPLFLVSFLRRVPRDRWRRYMTQFARQQELAVNR